MAKKLAKKQKKMIPWGLLIGVFFIAWVASGAIAIAVHEGMTFLSLIGAAFGICSWVMIVLGILEWRKVGGEKWQKTIRTGFWVAVVLGCILVIPLVILGLSGESH